MKLKSLLLAVDFSMFRVAREKFKVFRPIIRLLSVDMMNNLLRLKVSAYLFFHDKAVCSNVSINCKRVIRAIKMNVSISFNSAPFPVIRLVHLWLKSTLRGFRENLFDLFCMFQTVKRIIFSLIVSLVGNILASFGAIFFTARQTLHGINFFSTNSAQLYNSASLGFAAAFKRAEFYRSFGAFKFFVTDLADARLIYF